MAAADNEPLSSGDQFVPSLHIISGATVQEWEGTAVSEICRGCTFPNAASTSLRPPSDGNDRDLTPYVGAGLELSTPEFALLLPMRIFVGGEFAAAFGVNRSIAKEGEPSIVQNPAPAGASNQPFDEDTAIGQGTDLLARIDHFTYGAHAGLDIPFELYGRQVHFKPLFAWMQYGVDVEADVADAECFQPPIGLSQCNQNLGGNRFLRPVSMHAEGDETFDGIGPGFDVELDTGRHGPVGSSIFIGARFYKILGDRNIDLESPVVSYNDPAGADQARARFSFEVDPWFYRVGVGFRLHWLGAQE